MKEMQFYRCTLCNGVVSEWDVNDGGCKKCGGTRIKPANLSLLEKLVQIWKHPRIWEWGRE